jgi:hypothetical protein
MDRERNNFSGEEDRSRVVGKRKKEKIETIERLRIRRKLGEGAEGYRGGGKGKEKRHPE